jgi:putative membrane-bound dehydrogenase-like protein
MFSNPPNRHCLGAVARSLACLASLLTASQLPAGESGLIAPEGFTVTRYAPDDLAHDIHCLTIDSLGRVVVSGPGYVKILIDRDGDGQADESKTFVDGPESGAQGLCFVGRDLLCIGDEGLIRYPDENGDDRADGPPETFLKIKTGGEHHAHAIRRGPDGWWYLIAGNFTDVNGSYATTPTSPIRSPNGGVVLRLTPDLSRGEIVADGLRNAYDFDFDSQGEILTYDSDGERDISLPWYQPTRVLHVLPGGEQGWVTETWKRPNYFLDAAPVVAATGRGSPTGVVCYQHTQFPAKYRQGLFVLDWTFGRVLAVPLVRQGGTFAPRAAEEFVKANGAEGFAPTDAEVGPDGSLFICVGGRGTHGTVYKVRYDGASERERQPQLLSLSAQTPPAQQLQACLEPIQHNASWSRAVWAPLARQLGEASFVGAALNEQLPAERRVRAIQILVDQFGGLTDQTLKSLTGSNQPAVRTAAAWSIGFQTKPRPADTTLAAYLGDSSATARRRTLESLARLQPDYKPLLTPLADCLNHEDREVRLAAARLVVRMQPNEVRGLAELGRPLGWRAALSSTIGYVWRTLQEGEGVNPFGIDFGTRVLAGNHPASMKLEAARLIQMSLGDLGGRGGTPGMFHGYTGTFAPDLALPEISRLVTTLEKIFPVGDRGVDAELGRIIAMLAPPSSRLAEGLLGQVTPQSHPVDDIHQLTCVSRLDVTLSERNTRQCADALLAIEGKIRERQLPQDANWNDRLGELFSELVNHSPDLAQALVATPRFGQPSHVAFLSKLEEDDSQRATEAFTRAVQAAANYPWNNDLVYVVGGAQTDESRQLIRPLFERHDLRLSVLMVLAETPQEEDRPLFVEGLESAPPETLAACVGALERLLETEATPRECVALVKLLRRLGSDRSEFPLREKVARLLARQAKTDHEFVFGSAGYVPQAEVIQRWTEWATATYPEESRELLGTGDIDEPSLRERLAAVDWSAGDVERGEALFRNRGCGQCHGNGQSLGPDLLGVTSRFSRDDLFIAIALPNRDVSPRYQTVLVETKSGKTYSGLVVYDSADGILLRNGVAQTYRVDARDIVNQRTLPNSLMPEGLLKDLDDRQLADLYLYLKSQSNRTAARDTGD